jgi:hypothetical protein
MFSHVLKDVEKFVVGGVKHLFESGDGTVYRLEMKEARDKERVVKEEFSDFSCVVWGNHETKFGGREVHRGGR